MRSPPRAPFCAAEIPPPTRPQGRVHEAPAPEDPPHAVQARCRRRPRQRVNEPDDPSARTPPANLWGRRCPGRAHPGAAATLHSGGASGSRTALSLSSFMLETRAQRPRGRAAQPPAPAAERGRARTPLGRPRPASPEQLTAPQRLAGPTEAGPPALDLSPTQHHRRRRRRRPFTGAEHERPPPALARPLFLPSVSERARTRTATIMAPETHQWRDSAREAGQGGREERSG